MIKREELENRAEEPTTTVAGAEVVDEAIRRARGVRREPKAEEIQIQAAAVAPVDDLARLTAKIRGAIAAVRIQRAPRGIPDGASWGMGRDAAAAAIEAALGGQ